MSDGVITRPALTFDGPSHTYDLPGWEGRTMGISTVAKIGEAEDSFSIGSAWGFRIGYEGAREVLYGSGTGPTDPSGETGCYIVPDWAPDTLRERLNKAGHTPWGQRDRAAKRGNWAHDLLEGLANSSDVDAIVEAMDKVDAEHEGHAKALLQWFIDYRPSFVATEVQVASVKHGFAGRYDIRCKITTHALYGNGTELPPTRTGGPEVALCLVDLKTSKRIYALSHFVQLEGYEGASVEMGFPATDVRFVLNTHPDGTYDFEPSYATYEDFLAYLEALRAIRRLKALDPEERLKRELEEKLLAHLPGTSRQISEHVDMTPKEIGGILGRLRKRGLCEQLPDRTWISADASAPIPPEGGEAHQAQRPA